MPFARFVNIETIDNRFQAWVGRWINRRMLSPHRADLSIFNPGERRLRG
jgi:hypothetical protein